MSDEGQDKKLLAWLRAMTPGPVDDREKRRMAAAIEADLVRCAARGASVEERLETFRRLGYLYEGMVLNVPKS